MRFVHPDHPGHAVRLAYCLNLHAAETLAETLEGVRTITLPLRDRLAPDAPFGIGVWLPATVAAELTQPAGADDLEGLASFLEVERLDPFTFNAFPYGGFHRAGLKENVYRPTWTEPERAEYTLAVARIAARLNRDPGEAPRGGGEVGHISISTHPGAFGAWVEGRPYLAACARGMGAVVHGLAAIEANGGPRTILSLEAEPRASAGDTRGVAEFLIFAHPLIARLLADEHGVEPARAAELAARHLGTCLDCCHSAVEFEGPDQALALATHAGPLGKLQFSSALVVTTPASNPAGRAALLALDEPRYLHQVTGHDHRPGFGGPRALDLPELAAALETEPRPWLACDEWRCHFHVPVDLATAAGLGTTRAHADALLGRNLADPSAWTTPELHVEIETYTWDVLPGSARGTGNLVDGLEREYAHVLPQLERAGWVPESRATGGL